MRTTNISAGTHAGTTPTAQIDMNYTLTTFQRVQCAWVEHSLDVDLETLGEVLTSPHLSVNKEDVPLFNLCRFRTLEEGAQCARSRVWSGGKWTGQWQTHSNLVRRCSENVIHQCGLVLDIDGNTDFNTIIDQLADLWYIIYTTHSHRWSGAHRFRVVIPYSRPLLQEDVGPRISAIMGKFSGVDRSSFSASQSFYMHSSPDVTQAFSCVSPGRLLDPYSFQPAPPPTLRVGIPNTGGRNCPPGAIDALLGRIRNRVGNLRGNYSLWRDIAWATRSCVDDYHTRMLLQKWWQDKTRVERDIIHDWVPSKSPGLSTLLKLGECGWDEWRLLRLNAVINKLEEGR